MATKSKPRPTPQPQRRSIPIVGIAFVVIAAILVLAIVLTGGDSETGPQFGDVAVDGGQLAAFPQNLTSLADDPAVGQSIPAVSGVDLDGNPVSIGPDQGPQAITFLAHWCPHCRDEVPKLTSWLEQTGGVEGVNVVSVATRIDPVASNYPPDEWLWDENWPVVTMRDDEASSALRAYGAGGVPFWVFVDGQGQVVARFAGRIDIPTLESLMTLARDA